MFSRIKTGKFTKDYWDKIRELKNEIEQSDAILIGAGSGLSTSAGLEYGGKRFRDNFSDYADKYGLKDMYSAGFYHYDTLEEYWAYWSKHIYLNRYKAVIGKPYTDLLKLIKDKDYFVLTTNVDHCFQRAGFDKQRLFYTQGDYGLWQCSKPCHHQTYDNELKVKKMILEQKDMKIKADLIPYCPKCGSPMTMNLRIDGTFVQDKGWYRAFDRYKEFLERHDNLHILFLELGVGNNTPVIIKYPFWNMTFKNKNAIYACINYQNTECLSEISKQTIFIQADIEKVIKDLLCYEI